MNPRTRLALEILTLSFALGVAGNALLRVGPWGINVAIWLILLMAGATALEMRHRAPSVGRAPWIALVALLPALGIAWRDSPALKLLDLGMLGLCLSLALIQARGTRLARGGIVEFGWRFFGSGVAVLRGGLPLFVRESWWTAQAAEGWGRQARAVSIGALVATPWLIVFGALFASADAVFRNLVGRLIGFDFSLLMSHLIPTVFCAWGVAGALISLKWNDARQGPARQSGAFAALGPLEIGVALGLLNALFLGFILIQIGYLFGGASLIQVTPELTYAGYARQGFFQLVAVVCLAVPGLLLMDAMLTTASRRGYRWQAFLMTLLLAVILASAYHRMHLYVEVFGWTELRFFVTALMAWLVMALGCFLALVLTGHRDRFVPGLMLATFAWVAALHLANPDAWIARSNLDLARAGRGFDAAYAAQLSADAVPSLIEAWPTLTDDDRSMIAPALGRRVPVGTGDWRLWSWSHHVARQAVLPHREFIQHHAPPRN